MTSARSRWNCDARSSTSRSAAKGAGAPARPLKVRQQGNLKPWREVVTPHRDVASGRYQQAEFAADLWQVHLGEGTDEYKHPVESRSMSSVRSRRTAARSSYSRATGSRLSEGDDLEEIQRNLDVSSRSPIPATATLYGLQSVAEIVSSCGEDVYDRTLRWDVSVNFP